jgi:hypothetical protein
MRIPPETAERAVEALKGSWLDDFLHINKHVIVSSRFYSEESSKAAAFGGLIHRDCLIFPSLS